MTDVGMRERIVRRSDIRHAFIHRESKVSQKRVFALRAESIAAELDELPLPYQYDVKPFHLIRLGPLREHIERVGITVYPEEKE